MRSPPARASSTARVSYLPLGGPLSRYHPLARVSSASQAHTHIHAHTYTQAGGGMLSYELSAEGVHVYVHVYVQAGGAC